MSLALITNIFRNAVEKLTEFFTVITSDHNYIHQGKGFFVVGSATINDGQTRKFYFQTPNPETVDDPDRKYIHWRPPVCSTSGAGLKYELFEESSGHSVGGGAAVTPLNANRNMRLTKLTEMQTFVSGATVTTDGTLIKVAAFGTTGNPAKASGGANGENDEIVLLPNTIYSVTLTNLGGANTVATWEYRWYEERKYTK